MCILGGYFDPPLPHKIPQTFALDNRGKIRTKSILVLTWKLVGFLGLKNIACHRRGLTIQAKYIKAKFIQNGFGALLHQLGHK